MVEPVRSTAYLGPDKGRWGAATWSDVVEAATGGLLDETHWVDLKQALPTGKATINTDLAKDLASLAVDGGLLVIGIEDHNSHAGTVCGVELAGLADRVDQVARDKVRPSLVVRSLEVPDPSHPGRGCLLVRIPPSAQAPHMVDYVYYGRSDRANARLSDEQVRRILADRARAQHDILADLRQMADDDPIATDDRNNGHLYLLARPETAPEEVLVDFLAQGDAGLIVDQMLRQIRSARGGPEFAPDLVNLPYKTTRAEGHAFTTENHDYDPTYESTMLDLLVREDGEIRLTCGRGTDLWSRQTIPAREPVPAVIPGLVLGLTRSLVAFAGQLGDQHAAYQGLWQLGIRMDRLRGVQPTDKLDSFGWRGDPYNRDDYERVTTASTEQLVNTPHAVAHQLVAPLLRGLGVAQRYPATTP